MRDWGPKAVVGEGVVKLLGAIVEVAEELLKAY